MKYCVSRTSSTDFFGFWSYCIFLCNGPCLEGVPDSQELARENLGNYKASSLYPVRDRHGDTMCGWLGDIIAVPVSSHSLHANPAHAESFQFSTRKGGARDIVVLFVFFNPPPLPLIPEQCTVWVQV